MPVPPSSAQAGLGENMERGNARDIGENGKREKKNGEQSPDTISLPPQSEGHCKKIRRRRK
jgi:hypothetical protein